MERKPSKKSASKRRISTKRFNIIEATLRSCYQAVEFLKEKIAVLVEIISSKSILVPSEKKGVEPTTAHLTSAQLKGYKLQLKEAKLDLKKSSKALKKAEAEFREACEHDAACVMEKNSKFNSGLAAEYKAKREKDERKQKVVNIVANLQTTGAEKFTSLYNAVQDGYYSFRKEMDAILQQEDEETYTTISGLSAVKTEIYKSVKVEFFSASAVDSSADNNNNNEDEDTASAVVTAG